jgi:hypothetical protein
MKKLFTIAFIFFLLKSVLLAQDELIFFDNLFKNPSYTGDSTFWNNKMITGWGGYTGLRLHFSVDKFFQNINSGIGARYDLNGTYSRSYEFLYSYSFTFNKLKMKFGTSFGLLRLKLNSTSLSEAFLLKDRQIDKLLMNIGVSVYYINHKFGVAYINNEPSLRPQNQDMLLINYATQFQISNSFKLFPEFVDLYNVNKNNVFLSLKVSYSDKYIIGFLNNSLQTSSFMLSYILKKKFEFGFFLSQTNYLGKYPYTKQYGVLINLKL